MRKHEHLFMIDEEAKAMSAGDSRAINGGTHGIDIVYRMEMPDLYLSYIGTFFRVLIYKLDFSRELIRRVF